MCRPSRLAASAPSSASQSTTTRVRPSPQVMPIEKTLRSTICANENTIRNPSSATRSAFSSASPMRAARANQELCEPSSNARPRACLRVGLAVLGEDRLQLVEQLGVDVGACSQLRIHAFDRMPPGIQIGGADLDRLESGVQECLVRSLVFFARLVVEPAHGLG